MSLNWLFGSGTQFVNGTLSLRSQTLYIEHVEHVVRYVAEHQENRLVMDNAAQTAGRTWTRMTDVPKLQVWLPSAGATAREPRDIEIVDLTSISRFERKYLALGAHGASASISFHAGSMPTVHSVDPVEQEYLIRYLAGVGVPRVPWKRALFTLPILSGVGLLTLWLIGAIRENEATSYTALLGCFTVLGVAALIVVSRAIHRKYINWYPGHRIRESTETAYRDRIANIRATALVSAISVPLGAAVGSIITVLIKG